MEDRERNFFPSKYAALRKVPLYQDAIKEEFGRCLDLYICPRVLKKKINVAADQLIPDIPNSQDLKPFPQQISIQYKGHKAIIRSTSVSSCGRFLASGDDDGKVFVFDVITSRVRKTYEFEGPIKCVAWNPNANTPVLAVVAGKQVTFMNCTTLFNPRVEKVVEGLVAQCEKIYSPYKQANKTAISSWSFLDAESEEYKAKDQRIVIEMEHFLKTMVWHGKGDYFSTLADSIQTASQVLIHSFSKT